MPDKLRAVEQLAKLCGWNEAEKHEHGANNELTELLKRLRGSSPGKPLPSTESKSKGLD
jgi:hypothetical protein